MTRYVLEWRQPKGPWSRIWITCEEGYWFFRSARLALGDRVTMGDAAKWWRVRDVRNDRVVLECHRVTRRWAA